MDENDIGQQWSGFRRPFRGNPQQGTLLDVRGVERGPDTSPGSMRQQRRRQMVDAMPQTWAGMSLPEHGEVRDKIVKRNRPAGSGREGFPLSRMYEYPDVAANNIASDSAGLGLRAEMGKRLADETTVQPSHLEDLDRIDVGQTRQGDAEHGFMWPRIHPSAAAHYTESPANGPRIQAPRPMDTGTLAHEIGHHVSRFQYRNEQGSRLTTRTGLNIDPAEEGRADAFALEHAGDKRDYTYASVASGTPDEDDFALPGSPYRRAREHAGQPLRHWERSWSDVSNPPPADSPLAERPKQFEQSEIFKVDRSEVSLPYMGDEVEMNVYRPNPILERGRDAIGLDVPPNRGLYEVHGGRLSPSDTGYFWRHREGEERNTANYAREDNLTPSNVDEYIRRR